MLSWTKVCIRLAVPTCSWSKADIANQSHYSFFHAWRPSHELQNPSHNSIKGALIGNEGIHIGEEMVAEMWDLLYTRRLIKHVIIFKDHGRQFSYYWRKWKWKWSHSVVSDSLWPMDCSPPSSSIHGILQARILEWAAISFSRGSPAWQVDSLPLNHLEIHSICITE